MVLWIQVLVAMPDDLGLILWILTTCPLSFENTCILTQIKKKKKQVRWHLRTGCLRLSTGL